MAEPVATGGGDGEDFAARHVVDDRLLLNRVHMSRDDFPVDEELEFATDVLAYPTETNLTIRDVAVPGAGCALDPSSFQRIIQNCFLYRESALPAYHTASA